ncbi:unnamed protein product [Schistosoma mattheei]|uniref:Uncharacterized protein n=1 Tax=Schistosoma mattheei TaxID=31246 RepID=A0A183PLN4_9TREM|nr:unnamed protein product [Schistosoma mattheei]
MIDLENNLTEFERIKQDGYQKRLELEATAKQSENNYENVKSELEAIQLNHNYYSEQLNIIQNEYKQLNFSHNVQIFRCTIADLTKTNKTLVSEINILKRQTEEMNQLQTKRELQLSNLMKTRDSVLKKLKEDLSEKLSLNLKLSDQYIKMQEEQSKLLSLFYLAVTNSVLDQNQLFNAEQVSISNVM